MINKITPASPDEFQYAYQLKIELDQEKSEFMDALFAKLQMLNNAKTALFNKNIAQDQMEIIQNESTLKRKLLENQFEISKKSKFL